MMFHFVFWGSKYEYNKYCYRDLENIEDCEYIEKDISSNSKFLNFFFKLHTSKKTNKAIKMPFRKRWFKQLCNFKYQGSKRLCFVFHLSTKHFYALEYGFDAYLRKKYPGSILVCYYDDLVSSYSKNIDINFVKSKFDLVLSFDKDDCANYNLVYCPLVYSRLEIERPNNDCSYDICFIGRTKDRLNQILGCYDYLSRNNVRCDFHIVGEVAPEVVGKYPKIHFRKRVPYDENLSIISNSNAILEVMQSGGSGYTLRTCEAIALNKKLITNNEQVINEPFYDGNVLHFDKPDDIDIEFILKGSASYSSNCVSSISPLSMLTMIEEKIPLLEHE